MTHKILENTKISAHRVEKTANQEERAQIQIQDTVETNQRKDMYSQTRYARKAKTMTLRGF